MIKVKTIHGETTLTPTIFPDGTSQIWKLPDEILHCREYQITWNFESEREIIDLYSFKALLSQPEEMRFIALHIPYLPYARQDRLVHNESTFNLKVFADLINGLNFQQITSVDVHNPTMTSHLIHNFTNIDVTSLHVRVAEDFIPTYMVYPDSGAMARYSGTVPYTFICCSKVRDQRTGNITNLKLNFPELRPTTTNYVRLLIVDDICDGGATFIRVAKALRESFEFRDLHLTIGLFVTHGIFSKGREHVLDNGIDEIYTTNSLLKNKDGYKV